MPQLQSPSRSRLFNMRTPRQPRYVLLGSITVGFLLVLSVLLSHRSDAPVLFGRYSLIFGVSITSVIICYLAFLYLYLKGWSAFTQGYTLIACTLLSTIVLFVLANLVALVATFVADRVTAAANPDMVDKSAELDSADAPLLGLNLDELAILQSETVETTWVEYEPWVSFKEKPRRGRYVNISAEGFRETRESPREPKYWVFMFGGSTTFGYNVTDSQTIASYLQQTLNRLYGRDAFGVRNYGRGGYYSSQEFILLWDLLKRSLRPHVAIFFDGVNEAPVPAFTKGLGLLMAQQQTETAIMLARAARNLPLYQYLPRLTGNPTMPAADETDWPPEITAADLARQYDFNNTNIRVLCAEYKISPFFFIQPVAGHRNKYKTPAIEANPFFVDIVEQLSRLARERPSIVDLTGLLSDYDHQPFVDDFHYTPEVHGVIADAMFAEIADTVEVLWRSGR